MKHSDSTKNCVSSVRLWIWKKSVRMKIRDYLKEVEVKVFVHLRENCWHRAAASTRPSFITQRPLSEGSETLWLKLLKHWSLGESSPSAGQWPQSNTVVIKQQKGECFTESKSRSTPCNAVWKWCHPTKCAKLVDSSAWAPEQWSNGGYCIPEILSGKAKSRLYYLTFCF